SRAAGSWPAFQAAIVSVEKSCCAARRTTGEACSLERRRLHNEPSSRRVLLAGPSRVPLPEVLFATQSSSLLATLACKSPVARRASLSAAKFFHAVFQCAQTPGRQESNSDR